MIFLISLISLINRLLACEFNFIYDQEKEGLSYEIPQAEFIALGIWTRYYAFYLDIRKDKALSKYHWGQIYEYRIVTGFQQKRSMLEFSLIKYPYYRDLYHAFIFEGGWDKQLISNEIIESYEGIWMFTFIGFYQNQKKIDIFLINTKTDEIWEEHQDGLQVDQIILSGDFSGQISFSQTQSDSVKFNDAEELKIYLKSCNIDNQCSSNKIHNLISGILNTFEKPFQFIMQNNYWIDGWFLFTPLQSTMIYNNIILQIVQYDKESLNYNGIIPLKISLSFNQYILNNNGIIVETQSYIYPVWDNSDLDPIKRQIFSESYLQLIQGWIYFRFLQYDQINHNAEFYMSFSDSNSVFVNMGQLNLFKYGKFYIYIGQSQLNPMSFLGQIANINIQSCLQTYPQVKKTCHITCFTCKGPMYYHCVSCADQTQTNRIFNTITNSCNCKVGFISVEGQVQCMDLQQIIKSSTFQHLSIEHTNIQPCKQGQFQYQFGDQIKCYDCPQQSSLGLICADCLENMYGWQDNMMCSYDYYQDQNNQDNTFIKIFRPQGKIDYYYVNNDSDQLFICQGCKHGNSTFQLIQQNSNTFYGQCLQNYYYNNYSCYFCQLNCSTCQDITGKCSLCEAGFVLYNEICYRSPEYCLACEYRDKIICTSCLIGFTTGNGLCIECSINCLICNFDANLNRPKCQVCKQSGYFLPFDATDCVPNSIQNCQIQYELKLINYWFTIYEDCNFFTIITTLGSHQGCEKDHPNPVITIFNYCALCYPHYMNFETYCQFNDTLQPNEQVLSKNQCDGFCYSLLNQLYDDNGNLIQIMGNMKILRNDIVYLISFQNPEKDIAIEDCPIDQCIKCLNVKQILKCILCNLEYYENTFNGQCIPCPSSLNCQTCQQQNKYDKDGWKWNIKAYSVYQHESDMASSTSQNDQEIICLSCLNGYMLYNNSCIQNCPSNCQKCSIINGKNMCTFCGQNTQNKFLTVYNNFCSNCPNNCELCQPRSINDFQNMNSLFNPDDKSKYYYSYICLKPREDSGIFYNQLLQQYVKCKNGQFCMGQIIIKMKAHCDQQSFENEQIKYLNIQDFYQENILISKIFPGAVSHFSKIETTQFMEYLNENQIESLIYELTLLSSSDSCKLVDSVSTNVPRNVFSILKNKLIINVNNLLLTDFFGTIQNFSEVEIYQGKFYFLEIIISHPFKLIVRLKNISYISKYSNFFSIYIDNPLLIDIQNLHMQQMIENTVLSLYKIINYQYTNSSTTKSLIITIDNLTILGGGFKKYQDFLELLEDPKIINFIINVSNSIVETKFYESSFIKESQISGFGSINLINVTFNVQVYQASLIELDGQLNLYSSINLTGIFTSSNFIRTRQLNIMNSYIYDTYLINSTLIDNRVQKQDNQIDTHLINNIIFQNVQFDNLSNFITVVDNYLQDSLKISDFQIIDCYFIPNYETKSSQQLIIFQGAQFQLLNSHFQKSILGLTDIQIKFCISVYIDNVTVIGNNIQGLQKKLYCYQELVKISKQNGFIEMENIQSVQIFNSQFTNIMIQNQPLIKILCFDQTIKLEILVMNISFHNNLILKTDFRIQTSIFQFLSTGDGNFEAMNVSFTQNICNQYQQTKFSNSATTFLFEGDQFNITLNNAIFDKNQIFNTSDSIMYIKAKQIVIYNSKFTNSNLYDDFILGFVMWGSTSTSNNFYQENLQEIFPINSVGANAKFVVDTLLISFCQFSNSISLSGSGFHLTLQNTLEIQDTNFISLRSKLDSEESYGGSIFISLVAQNAKIQIRDSKFENSFSLLDGGAIYIESRFTTSNITLSQIIVQNCYSFKGAFISAYLNKHSSIQIVNVSVKNNISISNYYLSQIQDLNDNLVEKFHINSAIFYIEYGSLYISNSIISDIQLSSVLYFYSASNLYIYDSVILNIQFSSIGLIQIYPTSNIKTTTFIQNVKILNCNNLQAQQITCQIDIIRVPFDFFCQNNNNKPTELSFYPQDLIKKVNCFQNKLLDFNPSASMIYIDMIQSSDYLYFSNLLMINNNCSLCKDGMISIKRVVMKTPEFNNIIFKQLQFQNNICGSGCLVISQQSYINFPTRRLLQNILYQTRLYIPFTVRLEQSEFINNRAQNGIIIVSNLSLSVFDDKFVKNIGSELSGGVLFLGNSNHTFQITTSEISDNIGEKGGALYLVNKTISSIGLLQVLLSSNSAKQFGSDIVSTPYALTISLNAGKTLLQTKYIQRTPKIIQEIIPQHQKILDNYQLQQFIILPSGQIINNYQYYDEKLRSFIPYNLSLRLIALNNFNQQIFNLQNSSCKIQKRIIDMNSNNSAPFDDLGISISTIQFNISTQDYNLDQLIINFDPYFPNELALQLRFECSSILVPIINDSSPFNVISYSNNYELRMNIKTFKCQRGESYNELNGTCNLCSSSQSLYSVVIKASKCSVQDDITMKSVSSTNIELRQYYWRPYDDNNAIEYCYNLPLNCIGGWSTGDESCAQGHIGALCEQCDIYNIRGQGSYAGSGQFQCGSCSDISLNTLQIFIIIIWTLISILLSVKGTVENVDQLIVRMKGIKAGFVCVYFERVQIQVLMKIFTNYLQIISTIGTFQLKLPPQLRSMFTYSGNPIKSAMNSLDCFLVQLSNISILYFRNIWFIFMPIYYSTIIFIIYFLLIKFKYLKFKITVISTTLIFIFIYVQPDIIGSFVSLVSYRKISQVFWVQGNVSYLYLTPVHAKWLLSFVVPVLIIFGSLIPIILYIMMSKYKDKLNDTYVYRLYGYLYNEYSKATYYWEIIKIFQKELIIIFLTFYEDIIIIKGTLVFIIIFCYDIFSKRFKPYKQTHLNHLDSQSSFVCGFSIVLGMAIYFADQNGNTEILWPFYIIMGIFNLYFIIRLISSLIIGYLDKMADQLDKLRDYIHQKFPNITIKYPQLYRYLENSKIKSKRVNQRFLKLKEFLMIKVRQNLYLRQNQKIPTDWDQDIKRKELKEDSHNQEQQNDEQPIQQQNSNQKSQGQSMLQSYSNIQEQVNVSSDNQKQNNQQVFKIDIQFEQPQQENLKVEIIKIKKYSYESIPIEIEDIQLFHPQKDLQCNKDDEEQLNVSFQQ